MYKRVYQTSDNLTFETEQAAIDHEKGLEKLQNELVQKFYSGYSAKELKKYASNEYGIWEVRGEDSNCDMGGSHYTPLLGYFEGKLSDVVKHAVGLPKFWQWGAGGEVKKIEPIKI